MQEFEQVYQFVVHEQEQEQICEFVVLKCEQIHQFVVQDFRPEQSSSHRVSERRSTSVDDTELDSSPQEVDQCPCADTT